MNVLKSQKNRLKELRKELKVSQKAQEDYNKEYEILDKKYESRNNASDWGGLNSKINTLDGLINHTEKYVLIDRYGNLKFVKLRSKNAKDYYFFDGWMIGTLQDIPKSHIICPESWVTHLEISPKGEVKLYFRTPDYDNFAVGLVDGVYKVKSYVKNDGVLMEK